ncbi:MAG: sulfatase [Solirubrobacterales bacterium]|nr:sulfatase [Solirubrobacterales bacterium]
MITKRRQISRLLFGAAIAALPLAAAIGREPSAARAERPNIVVIETDDQSARTMKASYRGNSGGYKKVMPNTLREIVRAGTEFRDYYATSPLCSPSRASLLSGQYPHNSGLVSNEGALGGWTGWQNLPIAENNVPVALQRAGYRTSHFGKFINDYFDDVAGRVDQTVPLGWDRWFTTAFAPGTHYYGYRVNDNGYAIGPIGNPDYRSRGRTVDSKKCTAEPLWKQDHGKRCTYLNDVMTRAAVKELRRRSDSPFFLQIDYQAPHGDVRKPKGPQPATRHRGSAARTPLPKPPSFNEVDFSDKPKSIQAAAPQRLGGAQVSNLTGYYRRYLESLRSVDDGVGEIVKALKKTGRLNNTYIFFLSDHGYFFGEQRFTAGKFLPYDASSKVAMAVRGPDVPSGQKSFEVTGNIDLPATVLKLAGAKPGYRVDGRSLRNFWRDPARTSSRPLGISLATSVPEADAAISVRAPALRYTGFRVGPYKYVSYQNGEVELYDLDRDPWEIRNVATDPAYAAVLEYMSSHLGQISDCRGSGCRQQLPPWPEPTL